MPADGREPEAVRGLHDAVSLLLRADNPFAKAVPPRIVVVMGTVQEIKSAIDQLPLEEHAALGAELCGWTDDDWDLKMKADAKTGKFALLNEEASKAESTL